jgi:hypothetical protein
LEAAFLETNFQTAGRGRLPADVPGQIKAYNHRGKKLSAKRAAEKAV